MITKTNLFVIIISCIFVVSLNADYIGWFIYPKCKDIVNIGIISPNDFIIKLGCTPIAGDRKMINAIGQFGYLRYKCPTTEIILLHTTYSTCKRIEKSLNFNH